MEKIKRIKKAISLDEPTVTYINSKPKPSEFMRSAIASAVARESNPTVKVDIKINFTNTRALSNYFKVETILTNDFKAAILPFFDAVEHLQREIDRMNKDE